MRKEARHPCGGTSNGRLQDASDFGRTWTINVPFPPEMKTSYIANSLPMAPLTSFMRMPYVN
jgi:hypothetical protein